MSSISSKCATTCQKRQDSPSLKGYQVHVVPFMQWQLGSYPD